MSIEPSDISWLGHWRLKLRYDTCDKIPIEDVRADAEKWLPHNRYVFTDRWDTTTVINPITFEPVRIYRVRIIDTDCIDSCCLGAYDVYCSIEA